MFRILRDNSGNFQGYRFLVVVLLPALVIYPFVSHFRFSFSDSVGARLFWKKECPEPLERWDLVEILPDPNDPFIPKPGRFGRPFCLIKRIGCLPGEIVERVGLHFWCRAPEMKYDLGLTKLKSRKGEPLTPYTYGDGDTKRFMVPDGSYFVIGNLTPHSYDSRYFGPVEKERIKACFNAIF